MLGGPVVNATPQGIRHHWCGHVTPTEFTPFSHSDILCMHILTVAGKLHVHAGKNLQAQYERWQPRAKYKMHLDPTMEDVKKLAVSSRRAAKVDTLSLRHYRTQALHAANMHLHFVQPGHAGVAHCTSSLQLPSAELMHLHAHWVSAQTLSQHASGLLSQPCVTWHMLSHQLHRASSTSKS